MIHLYKNPSVDVAKTLELAATISRVPFMLVVDAKTLSECRGAALVQFGRMFDAIFELALSNWYSFPWRATNTLLALRQRLRNNGPASIGFMGAMKNSRA